MTVQDAMRSYFRAEIGECVSIAEKWRTLRRLGLGSGLRSPMGLPVSVDELNEFFEGPPGIRTMVGVQPVSRDVPYEKFTFRYVEYAEVDARGTDGIPVSYLHDCLIVILPVLLHIFDCSLQTGVFSTSWKSALVRPVPKIELPRVVADFRPISLLCAASKVFERIVYLQIREYVDRNKLMDLYQSGFRRGHSIQTALLRVLDDVRAAMDGLFLDMSEEQMDRIARCMNAAVRFFTNRRRWERITPDYNSNGILKYRSRIKYTCLSIVAAVLRSAEPEYLARNLVFHSAVVERETRTNGLCLSVSGAATTCGQISFAIGGARLWNSLPLGLREGFHWPSFVASLHEYLLEAQRGS
ncbi:unnamed protein product [Trichogramma brassicae]|uniref:Reverse transcriptase domain-containing protein n=1 Tax=Trichogramma brassicae TaxID=86971 RepID=A0A6H5IU39_9HYME|nr:unnamed protein product [Trichogramma brassicae]